MVFKILRMLFSVIFQFIHIIFGCRLALNIKSIISPGASIITSGKASRITIGNLTGIRMGSLISTTDGVIDIGNNCHINRNTMIVAHERISIGDHTTIGPNVCIFDHDHGSEGGYICAPIEIGNNVWIGAGVIILKGVHIGDNVTIAAGSLITKNIESGVVVLQKRESTIIKKPLIQGKKGLVS